ncbi:hypothetical protein RFI_15978 [Reticulomyxa filosa]|uniref:Uncharacterized protein n=1 Tax=Reticulomyxa filosa TaxID=46433 RepID=X6N5L7_RETFI|nr:hypothetical protein RFI_15978 [Reticulomyxa filosa]|eukprot:ETO21228.1 hypothetical protein RFI_15978 [Reticulomyxa filosa]
MPKVHKHHFILFQNLLMVNIFILSSGILFWLPLFLLQQNSRTIYTTKDTDDTELTYFDKASIVSRYTFLYMWPLILKGRKKPLEQEDLGKPIREAKLKYLYQKLFECGVSFLKKSKLVEQGTKKLKTKESVPEASESEKEEANQADATTGTELYM